MKINEITADELTSYVSELKEGYSLFEAEILQDKDYDLQAEALAHDIPDAKSASDLIDEVDPYTSDTQIWDDTPFFEFKDIGPYLSRFNTDSKLIEKYLSQWGDWHAGVFIEAMSEDELIKHLRSLLLVNMPEDGEVHYRLQETRKLAGILKALDSEERLSELLGPIKRIFWQQNCGADRTYFFIENPKPEINAQEMGWFSFTKTEKERINKAELEWYKRSIVSSVQQKIEEDASNTKHLQKYKPEEIEKFLDNGYDAAKRKNIKSEEGLRFFLVKTLYYPEFMNGKDAARIANQDLWLEPKKINLLKEMLEEYIAERIRE